MALPTGWTAADFSAWVDPILADCAAERVEWIYAHTPDELEINVYEYVNTGSTTSPLPRGWVMAEFVDWVTELIAAADLAYTTDVYSKIPADLRAPVQDYISADPPAKQWSDAVIVNGGTVSPARKSIIQNFIAAEMAAGTWSLTDDYWCLWAENPVQALTSIKQRRLGVAVNNPTFLANRHYEFNGTTQYIDTGFIPSTHAVAMTGTGMHIAVYERTNVAVGGGAVAAGCQTVSNVGLSISPRTNTNFLNAVLNSQVAGPGGDAVGDSRGLSVGSRNGALAADVLAYKNGTAILPFAPGTLSSALPTIKIYIGARSDTTNTAVGFRPSAIGFVSVGAGLIAAQAKAQFDNVQSWAIAVGAAAVGQDEITLWANAVIANGGSISTTRRAQVTNLINALKASSTWDLIDDAWLLVAENQPQALTSLKQRRLAVAVNNPTFTVDRGYDLNGTTSYIDTNFIPSVHAVALAGTNMHLSVYERTNVNVSAAALGHIGAGASVVRIIPRSSNLVTVSLNSIAAGPGGDAVLDSRGLTVASRNGTLLGDVLVYKNSVAVAPFATTTITSTLSAGLKIFIGCLAGTGNVPTSFRAATEGFASIGAAIPAGQQPAFYNAIQSHMTAIGAQVDSDPDVTSWSAAVLVNGGTVSTARLDLMIALVKAWKAAGVWPLIDDFWLLVAENAPQALTSLKQRRLAVAVNAPVFTIDRGYAFNGSSNYIDTLFTPSVNKVAMTGTNLHIAAYERTNVAAAGFAAGAYNFSDRAVVMVPRLVAGQMSLSLNSSPLGPGGDVIADSRGLSVGSRNGTLAADVLAYRNGVTVVPWQVGTISAVLTTSKLFIGCRSDNVNAPAAFRAATEGFVSVGAAIPAGQQPAFYNALQTYMTALGANV